MNKNHVRIMISLPSTHLYVHEKRENKKRKKKHIGHDTSSGLIK